MKKLFAVGLSVVMLLTMAVGVSAAPVATDSDDVEVTILTGGYDLDASPINVFENVVLKKTPTTYYTDFERDMTITDISGTQNGWKLFLSADPFEGLDIDHTLPAGSFTLNGAESIVRVGSGTGDLPVNVLQHNTIIDNGSVLVLEAEQGAGAGIFDVGFGEDSLGLTVDATTAKIGTYETTLTWDLVVAP